MRTSCLRVCPLQVRLSPGDSGLQVKMWTRENAGHTLELLNQQQCASAARRRKVAKADWVGPLEDSLIHETG